LLLTFLSGTARAELNFQPVILDDLYIAYERDVGDIDGDGDSDLIAIQEGDTTVKCSAHPLGHARHSLPLPERSAIRARMTSRLLTWMAMVTRTSSRVWATDPTSDGPGIAVWCENLGGGLNFTQHLIGNSLEYVKDIVVVDLDRDRRLDVAMRMDSRTQIWLREADGWSQVLLQHSPHEGMEAADLDMDGDPDLILNGFWFPTPDAPAAARVAANYTNSVIDAAWFNQTGDWTANSCKVVVADFDRDGKNDVAFSLRTPRTCRGLVSLNHAARAGILENSR
jgi:hypothetical protein